MSVKYCHRELSTYHRYQQKKKVAKKKTTTTNTVNLFQDLTPAPFPSPLSEGKVETGAMEEWTILKQN
jgi:hypothetical protein